jgi:very-short-patch-repair endonuclease
MRRQLCSRLRGSRWSARELRRQQTPAERRLWALLRNRGLGVKVRRQHPIAGFVVDFYISAARLVVEADGGVHDRQPEEDALRTEAFQALGLRVIRFPNDAIETTADAVALAIREVAAASPSDSGSPSPGTGEGVGG